MVNYPIIVHGKRRTVPVSKFLANIATFFGLVNINVKVFLNKYHFSTYLA